MTCTQTIKDIKADINRIDKSFFKRNSFVKWLKLLKWILFLPTFRFIFWFRIGHFLVFKRRLFLLKAIFKWIHLRHELRTGIQVDLKTNIGGGLVFSHFSGIVLTSYSNYGSNLTVMQNVTVGNVQGGGILVIPKLEITLF